MRLILAIALVATLSVPAFAQEEAHEVTAGSITIVHPWARAAAAGSDTLVFMEILNAGEPDTLESARTEIAGVTIVGATMVDGVATYQEVGAVKIASGDFDLDPTGLGLRLSALTAELRQGEDFELTLHFSQAGDIVMHVEIEAADATQHSHAGHSH